MLITKAGVLALILMTSACASNRGKWERPKAPKEPLRGGVAEFQVTSYDGEDIEGRVLIGATIDPLVIDGRLIPPGDVGIDVRTVRACGKKDLVGAVEYDVVVRPPRPDQIVTIRPGYWYGRKVDFWLFPKEKPGPGPGPGPECVEAEFWVTALDGRDAARGRIHAVRTDKPPAPPDGEAPAEPKPPPSDAGVP